MVQELTSSRFESEKPDAGKYRERPEKSPAALSQEVQTYFESPIGAPSSGSARSDMPDKAADLVFNDVHRAEDRFFMATRDQSPDAANSREKGMTKAFAEVSNFCDTHPDQAKALVRKLESEDLMSQLSITALRNASQIKFGAAGGGKDLSQTQANDLIARDDVLGDSMRDHLRHSFYVAPGAGFGGGYADASRNQKGQTFEGASGDSTPVITQKHLDDLMHNFVHPQSYRLTGVSREPSASGILGKILDLF